ncbi:dynein assembly factor 3, axonemal [Folsomia candida]|uniref:Dynein assembly factor 3, axonemal n=1 Tax=Folsomia candida TaxID=158441 RepID=A0A226EIP5_FOLCA|nr:dynein assembly factor 3, axonemal [Folsomia candida]OXA56631.1 Dynein assembly factor 3, axonemal [Folsomia candida]
MAVDEVRSGMGSLGFWGNTPACDLLGLIEKFHKEDVDNVCNILLMGQADGRHILKTLATHATDENELNIHLVESSPILFARQLLLIHLAFLPKDKIGLHEKTTQFMEIFGNILIRPQTRKTIRKCAETLIKVITDDNVRGEILPFVNFSDLKHRDRDMIVEILKFWSESTMTAEEMQTLWDKRLRHCLSSRYDSRMGAFDWDFQMRMTEKNSDTKIVNVQEYKKWRNCGLAFTEYENDYNQANVTFLPGKTYPYQGDILIGPFLPYGIKTEDKTFFEKANHEYKNKSQDITFHTLNSVLKTLSSRNLKSETIQIHCLPIDSTINLWKKFKFLEKFDFVLVSNMLGHQITPELTKLLKRDGVVVIDRTKYIWYFRDENDKAYEHKVVELADLACLALNDASTKDYLSFKVKAERESTVEEVKSEVEI